MVDIDRRWCDASGIKISTKQSSRLHFRFPIAHNPSCHHSAQTPTRNRKQICRTTPSTWVPCVV
ncbi:hypothetical protein DQ918_00565 [Salmonella enterica subsp. salamae]|nr:hypothetical protein [Salmonella enterica subsp. salamae]EDV9722692.1 hypothetical protein [Salmonella enterica subsp. salamae]